MINNNLPTFLHIVYKKISKLLLKSLVSSLRDQASFWQLQEYYYGWIATPEELDS